MRSNLGLEVSEGQILSPLWPDSRYTGLVADGHRRLHTSIQINDKSVTSRNAILFILSLNAAPSFEETFQRQVYEGRFVAQLSRRAITRASSAGERVLRSDPGNGCDLRCRL